MSATALPHYLVSVDLGQTTDHTAIAVAERTELPTGRPEVVTAFDASDPTDNWRVRTVVQPQIAGSYDLIELRRLPLGTPYTEIPAVLRAIEDKVRQRWATLAWERQTWAPSLADAPVELVVDQTGVGRPVVDLLREAGLGPVAVTITGGDQVLEPAPGEFRVPKRNLAGVVQVLLQTWRLRWAAALPEAATLRRELENFKAKISLSGHDSYGAGEDWRQGNHDDLVLAVALGAWLGEHRASARGPAVVGGWPGYY